MEITNPKQFFKNELFNQAPLYRTQSHQLIGFFCIVNPNIKISKNGNLVVPKIPIQDRPKSLFDEFYYKFLRENYDTLWNWDLEEHDKQLRFSKYNYEEDYFFRHLQPNCVLFKCSQAKVLSEELKEIYTKVLHYMFRITTSDDNLELLTELFKK